MTQLIAALAALLGAAGVALAALSAHANASPLLPGAAQMLMVHAAAGLALLAFGRGRSFERLFVVSAGLMVLGAALFAGDLSARAFLDHRLFPFAAPTGGSLTIVAWLSGALAAALSARRM